METERSFKIYNNAKAKVPEHSIVLVGEYEKVLRAVSRLFDLQEQHGFYFGDFTRDDLMMAARMHPELLSPYKLVRKRGGGRFHPFGNGYKAIDYKDEAPYRGKISEIVRALEDAKKYVEDEKPPQSILIKDSLDPQLLAWREARFEQARKTHINMHNLPTLELVTGLFDKYKDPWGIKHSAQGWLIYRNNGLTGDYNGMVQRALMGTGEEFKNRIVVGDAVAFAGLAALKEWKGNALPSEDELRKEIGSISYIFDNVIDIKFRRGIKEALLEYAPQVQNIKGWERLARKAMAIILALHEGVGHPLVGFNSNTKQFVKYDDQLLGGNYVYVKELESETRGQKAALGLPKRRLSEDKKRMVILTSLVWLRLDIDEYLQETDPEKKKVSLVYAQIGNMILNRLERGGGIKINKDNGQIDIVNLNIIEETTGKYLDEIREAVLEEKTQEGRVGKLIQLDTNNPTNYLSAA